MLGDLVQRHRLHALVVDSLADLTAEPATMRYLNTLLPRLRQAARFGGGNEGVATRVNARMTTRQIREHCRLEPPAAELLRAAVSDLGLSARAHDKVLRVARTIADLDAADSISCAHISEAINYRLLDRGLWT